MRIPSRFNILKVFSKGGRTVLPALRLLAVAPVYLLSHLIPKNDRIWIFGGIKGQKYCDNSRYLYEFVSKKEGYQAVWFSRNTAVLKHLKEKGLRGSSFNNPLGILTAMRAGVAVITHRGIHRQSDIPFFALTKKSKVVQLWHGVPLKKIAFDDVVFSCKSFENKNFSRKVNMAKFFFPYIKYVDEPDMVICLSDFMKGIFSKAFRVPERKVVVTGYPRNDMFFRHNVSKTPKDKKSIVYMPTFRGDFRDEFDPLFQFGFDIQKFDAFLESKRFTMTLKLHPFNMPNNVVLNQLSETKNIFFFEGDDIYEELMTFDVLITDYSSVYFDFLLADKPIVFSPFDKEAYLQNCREFYFDYDEVTPGPKALNWEDVLNILSDIDSVTSSYRVEREALKSKIHCYQDGNSCERVVTAILKL